MEMLANATVVIILQYRSVSNQRIVYLELTLCCISIISQKIKLNLKGSDKQIKWISVLEWKTLNGTDVVQWVTGACGSQESQSAFNQGSGGL